MYLPEEGESAYRVGGGGGGGYRWDGRVPDGWREARIRDVIPDKWGDGEEGVWTITYAVDGGDGSKVAADDTVDTESPEGAAKLRALLKAIHGQWRGGEVSPADLVGAVVSAKVRYSDRGGKPRTWVNDVRSSLISSPSPGKDEIRDEEIPW